MVCTASLSSHMDIAWSAPVAPINYTKIILAQFTNSVALVSIPMCVTEWLSCIINIFLLADLPILKFCLIINLLCLSINLLCPSINLFCLNCSFPTAVIFNVPNVHTDRLRMFPLLLEKSRCSIDYPRIARGEGCISSFFLFLQKSKVTRKDRVYESF